MGGNFCKTRGSLLDAPQRNAYHVATSLFERIDRRTEFSPSTSVILSILLILSKIISD